MINFHKCSITAHFFIFLFIALCIIPSQLNAQTDTLGTVVVSRTVKQNASRNAKFSPGTRIQKFDQIQQVNANNSLSDFLKNNTAIYIKEYGRGMNSYISMRGTSSSHTTIDWNGQSLAVPTMGQTDLSHIPLYFFDNMSVHSGGNSALYGNGSLSGNIQLSTTPTFNEGVSGDITLKGGSFSTLFGGGTFRYGKNGWESRTSGYYSYAKNNFKFRNNTKTGFPTERLNNSQYNNWGALQEVFKRFKDRSILQFNFMYLQFDREIQPSVSNNMSPESYHSIFDRNIKVSAAYNGKRARWGYNVRASYNHDYELYEDDVIAASRVSSSADAEYRTDKLSIRGGGSVEYIKPDVDAYESGTQEWRGDLFALLLWNPLKPLTIGGGIRGSFASGMRIPAQPSIDVKYQIIDPLKERDITEATQSLSVRVSLSKSAKIPTLNDRYWGGENTGLKAETGVTYEVGGDYTLMQGNWELKSFVTGYISDVNDWIRWLPAGEIWRPANVPEVSSRGIESGVGITKRWSGWKTLLNANYAYTNVKMKESLLANDPSIGHQMAYQPEHTLTANLGFNISRLTATFTYSYIGERTSTDIYDVMPGYSLLDFGINYKFVLLSQEWDVTGEVKNILNTSYQNIRFYAMPGINFALALQWRF